jgi:methylmalonyl-CoA mutase
VANQHTFFGDRSEALLSRMQEKAIANENLFAELMEACKVCTLGQITESLFSVGGQYRRNM